MAERRSLSRWNGSAEGGGQRDATAEAPEENDSAPIEAEAPKQSGSAQANRKRPSNAGMQKGERVEQRTLKLIRVVRVGGSKPSEARERERAGARRGNKQGPRVTVASRSAGSVDSKQVYPSCKIWIDSRNPTKSYLL
ncbi:hypothetical protein B0H12DRAFT_1069878 [Mycena haematopus]|nr:hypothetical protein B0H12DRAFT_1069878 [Mycena haematopus]